MSNNQITQTFDNLDDAIDAAKEAGNDIYAGYENCIAMERNSCRRVGVKEFFLTKTGRILYICEFNRASGRERVLNEITLGASLTSAPLALAMIDMEKKVRTFTDCLISKNDCKKRAEACKAGWLLVDQSLAADLAAA